jgi:hypothetical protein
MYGEYVWLICEYHQAIGRCQRPSEFKKICWPEAAFCWCWNCWWVETLKPTSWTEPKSKKNYKKHQKDQHFVSFYCMGVSGMSRLSRKKTFDSHRLLQTRIFCPPLGFTGVPRFAPDRVGWPSDVSCQSHDRPTYGNRHGARTVLKVGFVAFSHLHSQIHA